MDVQISEEIDEISAQKDDAQEYQLRIDEHLFRRIERQLSRLKLKNGEKHTKQAWIENAIEKKLKKNQGLKILNPKKKYRSIKLILKKENSKKMDHIIASLKKMLGGYSKKIWILDAIEDSLEEEEHDIEQILQEIQNTSN